MRRDRSQRTEEPPSKSERKREAHAAQDLGEALIGLPDAELERLELPEALLDALRAARRIASRSAGARQRQYIGKLMRDLDLEPVRARLNARSEEAAREAERFKRLEAWRERLVNEGSAALAELEHVRPDLDRDSFARLLGAAQRERVQTGKVGVAGRELFRALKALFVTMPR